MPDRLGRRPINQIDRREDQMARMPINGIEIDYELLGEPGAPAIALTPGGRFPRSTPGLRELGEAMAAGGKRVLLWDRPNCGASDIVFDAPNESVMQAETLVQLIGELELGPTALAAGSAGSRVSLLAAAHDPAAISHLVLWWISGGTLGLMFLGGYYCYFSAVAASRGGMEEVAAMPEWAEQLALNPRNREILLKQDPWDFIRTMERWAAVYAPSERSPVPGLVPQDFARLTMPVLILRNGRSDISHTCATTEWVHRLIPGSELRDPPWSDNEWNERSMARNKGEAPGLFVNWPILAPTILDFAR
jgi:pimeloyl-ACP methyl ester carboxylesterase